MITVAVAVGAATAAAPSAVVRQAVTLPDDPAKPTLQQMCTSCHALEVLKDRRETPERWAEIVEDMVVRGAPGTAQQTAAVAAYLAKYFGKAPAAAVKSSVAPPASVAVPPPPARTGRPS